MLLRQTGFGRLCRARDLLREVSDEAPTVEAVAASVGISPAHFSRQFAALFGATPHQFRMRARIDQARQLLADGRASVTDACMAVGCSSVGSFSALFTRLTGETPSAYRRRVLPLADTPDQRQRTLHPGCLTLLAHLPAESQFSRSVAASPVADCRSQAEAPGSVRCGSD
jgi:AraC-like DNA-binding protein